MRRKKKNKGVITDGKNKYEQLSLFTESIIGNAEGEESVDSLTVRNEWETQGNIDTISTGNRFSTDENAGRSNIEIENQQRNGLLRRNQYESSDSSVISGNDERMDSTEPIVQSANFRIVNKDFKLNSKEKFQKNINALMCIHQNKKYLSYEEQEVLSLYTGWGGLPQIFDENNKKWNDERNLLKNIVSLEQYQQMKASVLTSFYTPYEIIEGMYKIIDYIGFQQGKILDPSMGIGNFFGLMPQDMMESSSLYGVELDELSGKIAKNLYPQSKIQIKGYESTSYPNNFFDLVISNIPFGRYKVHDIDYNKYNLDIHNYFILKSLDKVKTGGIVAFITSNNTLDGNSKIRNLINERADLLGAIRLPHSVFNSNGANTSVVSDIIILQKKDENDLTRIHQSWLDRDYLEGDVPINRYFIEHPEMVFGERRIIKNQYGNRVLDIESNGLSFEDMLDRVLDTFPFHVFEDSVAYIDDENNEIDIDFFEYKNHEHFIYEDEVYMRIDDHTEKIREGTEQIKSLILIKNSVIRMIDIQKKSNDENEYQSERVHLNQLYDYHVKKYGYINTKKTISLFKNDPNYYLLTALEKVNSQNKEVVKSDFFFKRTIKPVVEIKSTDNLIDAYHYSLNYSGRVDLAYMETIYHKSQENILKELLENKLVYMIPFSDDEFQIADEYLSGNVRKKLKMAEEAEKNYPGTYQNNINDLRRVLPEWLTADQIQAQIGASWIPEKYYEQFVEELFEFSWYRQGTFKVQYSTYTGEWIINSWSENYDTNICEKWGVPYDDIDSIYSQPRYNGFDLFDDLMNSRIPTVRDYWDERIDEQLKRRSRVNQKRTAIARTLADKMKVLFSDWIYSDYDRRTDLENIYNTTLNNYVERKYDGSHLTFPDMNASLQLEDYQKNAVCRIISSKSTLLSQQVGAGKTFEMVTATMEMKRMKIANKCMIVVPNHLVDQWKNEFLFAYPQANILAATTKDFTKSKRNEFIHQIATNDYDAIIIAHSSFKLIPMSDEIMIKHMEKEIKEIEYGIESLKNDRNSNTRLVKVLERTKKSIEANIKKMLDVPRDVGITFDQLGVDFLFVDEAHEFKNLYIYSKMSNIAGVPQTKSQKASDMYMKTRYVLENNGGVCFATGTPISNTMAELYNIQRYLQEDMLHESHIFCFDAWAKNFGEVISSLEISIDGSGFKTRQRFSKFFNIQELMSMFRQVAEIQTEGMLRKALSESKAGRGNIVLPKHIGGKPNVVVVEPSEELENYICTVVERTEDIHSGTVDPHEDNMLKITTDSKKASIDLRLIDPDYGHIAGSKIDSVISNIYELWQEYTYDKATQLVFCDSSTPSHHFNVYDEIKKGLMILGVPENEIAFIHNAKTEIQKTHLFNKVKCGDVRVLIGSTAKLGAGTNVQDRLIAIHHVDVPWRASDIEQRNGRGFRQGNKYREIYEFRYVTKKSFDSYSWQMIETKASYMNQLLEGTTSSREIEENNSSIMSYAEVKAIASGNPLIKEKLEVDNELRNLQLEKQIFKKNKYDAERKLISLPQQISVSAKKIIKLEKDYPLAEKCIQNNDQDKIEEWFHVSMNDQIYTDMKKAGEVLNNLTMQAGSSSKTQILGNYCGFDFGINDRMLVLVGKEREYKLINEVHQVGRVNFVRLLKKIQSIPDDLQNEKITLETLKKSQKHYQNIIESNYPHDDQLMSLLKRQKELNEILDVSHRSDEVLEEENSENKDIEME